MKSMYITENNCGYEILNHEIYERVKNKDGITYKYGIVIAQNLASTQYVTWEFSAVISDNGYLLSRSYFWGHYIADRDTALLDYHERLISYYRSSIIDYTGD